MPCVVCILGRIKSVFSTISTLSSQLFGVCPLGHLVFVFSANMLAVCPNGRCNEQDLVVMSLGTEEQLYELHTFV